MIIGMPTSARMTKEDLSSIINEITLTQNEAYNLIGHTVNKLGLKDQFFHWEDCLTFSLALQIRKT